MRHVGHVGRTGVLAAAVLLGGLAAGKAEAGDVWGRCSVGGEGSTKPATGFQRSDPRTGATFAAELDDQNQAILRVTSAGFRFEKRVTSSGETRIQIDAADDTVLVSFSQHLLTVGRGAKTVSVDPRIQTEDDSNRVRQLLTGSRGARALRSLTTVLELRAPEEDDVFATALLIDGALIGSLDGDPGAIARIAKRIAVRRAGRLVAVKSARETDRFDDCVGMYENTLAWAWKELVQCNVDASDDPWYLQSLNMSMCNAEWVLRSESAFFQFLSCMAVPMRENLL